MLYAFLMIAGGVLIIIGLGALMVLLPAFGQFVNDALWGPVSKLETFRMAGELVKGSLEFQPFTTENFGLTLFTIISSAVFEALLIGVSVYGIKLLFSRLGSRMGGSGGRNGQKNAFVRGLTRPAWLMTLAGVILGVSLVKCSAALLQGFQTILSGVVTIGLMLWGISLIFTSGRSKWPWNVLSRTMGRLLNGKTLAVIAGDAISAAIGVILVTCALRTTEMVHSVPSFFAWVLWIVACLVAISLIEGLVALTGSRR